MISEFKSPTAATIINDLLEARAEFEQRRKGQEWRAIMSSVAAVFPEDRLLIYTLFGNNRPPAVQTGGAREVPSPYKAGSPTAAALDDDGPGCPKRIEIEQPAAGKPIVPIRAGQAEPTTQTTVIDADFIFDNFGGDANKLTIRASQVGLKLGNTKDPRKIAAKIADHINATQGITSQEEE